jgi:glycerophosphoryl diester phosphodiesterase
MKQFCRAGVVVVTVLCAVSWASLPVSAASLNLHRGSRGAVVRTVEARLHLLGLLSARAVDRRYTQVTTRAVKRFQRAHQLRANGRVNRPTWDAIARASRPKPPPPPPPKPILMAHRGGALESDVPENSLSSMRYGVAAGADILEFDLQLTAGETDPDTGETGPGTFVLMHDDLERTTTCTGKVSAMTLSELQEDCVLKRPDGTLTEEHVPTYAEVAAYAQGAGKSIAPEIKISASALTQDAAEQFVSTTQDAGLAKRTYVQSFDGTNVFPKLHTLAPSMATIFLTMKSVNPAVVRESGSTIVAPEFHTVNAPWLSSYHSRGLRVWAWTVDDAPTMKKLWYLGANGLFTNYPATARSLVR